MDLRRIDLNGLVALDVLLSECSVTRAAEQLGIGQPAASAALARMRKLFDDPLLVKDGRGLRLSYLATSLVEPLREALNTIDGLVSMSESFDPSTTRRSFSMNGTPTALRIPCTSWKCCRQGSSRYCEMRGRVSMIG